MWRILKGVFVVLVCLTLAAAMAAAAELSPVKDAAFRGESSAGFLCELTARLGLYKKHGLAVETALLPSGGSNEMAALLLRGRLDFATIATTEAIVVISRSLEIGQEPPISIIGDHVAGLSSIVVAKNNPARTIRDLAGKRIGVSSLSSAHVQYFASYLRGQGLGIKDFQLVPVRAADMPPTLVAGQIGAFIYSEPTTSIAVGSGAARILVTPEEMGVRDESRVSTVGRKGFLKQHGDLARRYLRALHEGAEWIPAHPGEAAEMAAKFLKLDREVVASILKNEKFRVVIDSGVKEGILKQGQALVDAGRIKKVPPAEVLFDLQFLPGR